MTEVTIRAPSGDMAAHLAVPLKTEPCAGVVVIHGAVRLGGLDHLLPGHGYRVLAPRLSRVR
jgi:hypothetical protein